MKKLAIIAALSTLTLSAFSQGQVAFQNAITSQLFFANTAMAADKVTAATIGSQPASALTAGAGSSGVVDVGLYWSTAVFTDPSQGTLADTVTMSSTAGTIAGPGTIALPVPGGSSVYVQVYAWDSTYSNPDAALAAGGLFAAWSAGPNNTIYGAIGAPQLVNNLTVSPGPGVPIFGTGPGQFGRAVFPETPEPATIAIGGLGAAALLLFRRRK
jgi:hypothetical protein